jgi:hypothetical protein
MGNNNFILFYQNVFFLLSDAIFTVQENCDEIKSMERESVGRACNLYRSGAQER